MLRHCQPTAWQLRIHESNKNQFPLVHSPVSMRKLHRRQNKLTASCKQAADSWKLLLLLLARLVYKYRNKHLKILLKLFHNLRLFDAKPLSWQCSCSPILLFRLLVQVCANSIAKPHYSFYPCERNFPTAITTEKGDHTNVLFPTSLFVC